MLKFFYTCVGALMGPQSPKAAELSISASDQI